MLVAPDGKGACFVAEATSHAVLRLWQEIVAARGLPLAPDAPAPAAERFSSPGYSVTLPDPVPGWRPGG